MKSTIERILFSKVARTCKLIMNHSHRSILPLVATNKAVVEVHERNFGDEIICEPSADTKTFDAVLFDILQIPPEDIANQLTLIDLPLFQDIPPDELTSCQWTGKKKYDLCPNIVKFTKRFNQVSFWVTTEILDNNTAKIRAEIVTHFIRVAKKLLELNNLNSLKAVVSSLHSAPIHRLAQTWHLVPKREKDRLEKLQDLTSEDSNKKMLRNHLSTVRLPCIPYLGMYLTDLTYIDTIHPCTGGLDKERTDKMNEILRVIADFQHSEYDELVDISYIQNYLKQEKYFVELQKFVEDDNYKMSQAIEPNVINDKSSKSSSSTFDVGASDSHELLYPPTFRKSARNPPKNLSRTFRSPSPDKKQFQPGHRKVKSLGSHQQFLQTFNSHDNVSASLSHSPAGSHRNLVDDSVVVDDHKVKATNSCDSDQDEPELHPIVLNTERRHSGIRNFSQDFLKLEGFLKRKTFMKNGSKPSVGSWRRFWVGLKSSTGQFLYYLPKHTGFGGHDRENFRPEPHKVVSLIGCTVFVVPQTDLFKLIDERCHTVYHFRAGSYENATVWCKAIKEAADGQKSKEPKNLIDFGNDVDRTVIRDTSL